MFKLNWEKTFLFCLKQHVYTINDPSPVYTSVKQRDIRTILHQKAVVSGRAIFYGKKPFFILSQRHRAF